MSYAAPEGLVESPVGLYLVPLAAIEQAAALEVLVVVLSLQLHLLVLDVGERDANLHTHTHTHRYIYRKSCYAQLVIKGLL